MSKEKRLIKNSIIFAIGNFGSKMITFLMLPYYTLLLSTSDYGKIDLIVSSISLLIPIISLNLFEAAFRFGLDQKYNKKEVISNSLLIVLLMPLIILILYPMLAKINIFKDYFILFMGLIYVNIIQLLFKNFTKAINKINVYMYSDFVQVIVFVFMNFLLIGKFNLGVNGYLLARICSLASEIIILFIFSKIYKYINLAQVNINLIKEMIIFGIPLIPNSIMWWINNLSDRYILNFFYGPTSVGLYSFSSKLPTIISTFSGMFTNAWQISAIEERDNKNINQFYSQTLNIFIIFLILISAILFLIIRPFNELFISNEFKSAWIYIGLLVIASVLSAIGGILGTHYTTIKNTKGALKSTVSSAGINIVLNIILIPIFNIHGAIIATIVSMLVLVLVRFKDVNKDIKINLDSKIKINILLLIIQLLILTFIKNIYSSMILQIIISFILIFINKNNINIILRKKGKVTK